MYDHTLCFVSIVFFLNFISAYKAINRLSMWVNYANRWLNYCYIKANDCSGKPSLCFISYLCLHCFVLQYDASIICMNYSLTIWFILSIAYYCINYFIDYYVLIFIAVEKICQIPPKIKAVEHFNRIAHSLDCSI